MGDGFYRSKDPTNSIKVLKVHIDYKINRKKYNNDTINTKHSKAPSLQQSKGTNTWQCTDKSNIE